MYDIKILSSLNLLLSMPEEEAREQLVARIFLEELRRLEDRKHIFVSLDNVYSVCYTSDKRTLEFVEPIFAHLRRPRNGKRRVFFVVDVHDDPGTNDSVAGDMYAGLRSLVWNASRTPLEDLQGNLEMVIETVYEEEQGRTRFKIALTRGATCSPHPYPYSCLHEDLLICHLQTHKVSSYGLAMGAALQCAIRPSSRTSVNRRSAIFFNH